MRSGVLEKIRILEADLESCRNSVVQQLLLNITNHRHQVLRDHFILQQAAVAKSLSEKLLDVYLDEDDIEAVRNEPTDEGDVLEAVREFDSKVAELREYHKRYPDVNPIERTLAAPDPAILDNVFSYPEHYGAYLDILPHYESYRKFVVQSRLLAPTLESQCPPPVEFYKFAENLPAVMLTTTPCIQKLCALDDYEALVAGFLTYLRGFYSRWKPLDQTSVATDLESAEAGYHEFRVTMKTHQLGAAHLKRFTRSYAVWDHALATERGVSIDRVTSVGVKEAQIAKLLSSSLSSVAQATEKHTVRLNGMTAEEVESARKEEDQLFRDSLHAASRRNVFVMVDHVARAELDAHDDQAQPTQEDADNDDDEPKFVGADGKALPAWQVKMMQLKKMFPCEVCGGEVFKGPKVFREHFTLERHSEGLRQLGVSYDMVYYYIGISRMGDVLKFRDLLSRHFDRVCLRKRIREDADNEETQDIHGNVMTAKSFSLFQGRRNAM